MHFIEQNVHVCSCTEFIVLCNFHTKIHVEYILSTIFLMWPKSLLLLTESHFRSHFAELRFLQNENNVQETEELEKQTI